MLGEVVSRKMFSMSHVSWGCVVSEYSVEFRTRRRRQKTDDLFLVGAAVCWCSNSRVPRSLPIACQC